MSDNIKTPGHYTFGVYEVLDVIEDWKLPHHLANVVKYVARAGRKDPSKKMEDLCKAAQYLERYIDLNKKYVPGGKKAFRGIKYTVEEIVADWSKYLEPELLSVVMYVLNWRHLRKKEYEIGLVRAWGRLNLIIKLEGGLCFITSSQRRQ